MALPTAEPGCIDLIARLLAFAPAERPNASDLLRRHLWLTQHAHPHRRALGVAGVPVGVQPAPLFDPRAAAGGGRGANCAAPTAGAAPPACVPCVFFDTRCLTMERAQMMTLAVTKQFRPDLPVPDDALCA